MYTVYGQFYRWKWEKDNNSNQVIKSSKKNLLNSTIVLILTVCECRLLQPDIAKLSLNFNYNFGWG